MFRRANTNDHNGKGNITRRLATTLSIAAVMALVTSGTWSAGAAPMTQGGTQGQAQPDATCPSGLCFSDVPNENPFADFINNIYEQDIVTGYACGGPGEPCDAENHPYYRPAANVTRGQMAKFIDNARHLPGIYIQTSTYAGIPIFASTTANGTNGVAIKGSSDAGTGINGISLTGRGVYGFSNSGSGVYGSATTPGSKGVYGSSFDGTGVYGMSTNASGVFGISTNRDGVKGQASNPNYYGVNGTNTGSLGIGVFGSGEGAGVKGSSAFGNAIFGESTSGIGVVGTSDNNLGMYGQSASSIGVKGISNSGTGVRGESTSDVGVHAISISDWGLYAQSNSSWAVYASGGTSKAGYFNGNVQVTGDLTVNGSCCGASAGYTEIDHPLAPTNQTLRLSNVGSPDMKTVFDGNVTTDANGEATVQLPDYFEALNTDYRYQLTTVGQFAQAIISKKIENNSFTIKTDKPNVEVSWMVTGIRNDPYARQHPVVSVEDKPEGERGLYKHPEAYGQPPSKGIAHTEQQKAASQGNK